MGILGLQMGVLVALVAAIMDRSTGRRVAVIVILLCVSLWVMHTKDSKQQLNAQKRRERVLAGLPHFAFCDAQLADVDSTPGGGRFPHVEANDPVVSIFALLRSLRLFNEHTFAQALTYADYLLEHGGKGSSFTLPELVLLKDKVVNTLAEFTFVVPARFQRDMRLADKLRALDTVLFMEAIAPVARSVDIFPLPNDPPQPGLYSGH
jgi:hypothetical protein